MFTVARIWPWVKRWPMMPTIRIDDDVWNYLKSKAAPFEDTPNDVLRRELKIVGAQPRTATTEGRTTSRTHPKPGKDYSYHPIKGFRLEGLHKDGKFASCRSYSEMMKLLSSYLWLRHMDSFAKVALELRGKKRPYFSKNAAELRKPHKLAASDIFVETNLSANNIVAISRVLLEKLGHDPDSLVLE
jgi:negative regulator of replication initiation